MKLRIEKAIYGGNGLARVGPEAVPPGEGSLTGKTLFIPNALPGELVEAHITGNRRSFSTAQLDSILEPSVERTIPGCEYFPQCGGCQYQHANAAYQLRMKLDILRETLERAHLPAGSSIAGTPAEPWAYRNRIRLHVAPAREGPGFHLCYRERGSHINLPVTHCPIAAPLLQRAITAVLQCGEGEDFPHLWDEIEFFTDGEQEALLISLWNSALLSSSATNRQGILENFAQRLQVKIPELIGIGLFSSDDPTGRLIEHWGRSSLQYAVSGHSYRVSLGSFFQVNRFLVPQLLELVVSGRSGDLAWDLYSGVGLFARALNFRNVTAVESAAFSVADLRHNLAETRHRAVQSSTIAFLRSQVSGKPGPTPDLILLDPPRTGLGADVCALLARISAPAMIYVSCDPATLARDLQTLLHSGYHLQHIQLIDLFPQTFHLETMAVLVRE